MSLNIPWISPYGSLDDSRRLHLSCWTCQSQKCLDHSAKSLKALAIPVLRRVWAKQTATTSDCHQRPPPSQRSCIDPQDSSPANQPDQKILEPRRHWILELCLGNNFTSWVLQTPTGSQALPHMGSYWKLSDTETSSSNLWKEDIEQGPNRGLRPSSLMLRPLWGQPSFVTMRLGTPSP